MKIRFLKDHGFNAKGFETEAPDSAAKYLIRVGAAEEVKIETFTPEMKEFFEKVEAKRTKEKIENKTGNVPTAKKKKK